MAGIEVRTLVLKSKKSRTIIEILLWCIVASGLALRVVAPDTMPLANDQAMACALAQDVAAGDWQTSGLVNSGGFRNPPGFVYLLAAVWKAIPHPIALVVFIQCLNAAALVVAWWFAGRIVGRRSALWGTAFFAASPWAIEYCRWIWAQDLLFPFALAVYMGLWRWLVIGRPWAALWTILALIALVEIHLAGIVLAVATLLLVLIWRPRISWAPLSLGFSIALVAAIQYWASGEMRHPPDTRLGIVHFWRVFPAAAISVSGACWWLVFDQGYAEFVGSLGYRQVAYLCSFFVAPLLVLVGFIRIWKSGQANPWSRSSCQRTGATLIVSMAIFVPLSFVLLRIRTSPT